MLRKIFSASGMHGSGGLKHRRGDRPAMSGTFVSLRDTGVVALVLSCGVAFGAESTPSAKYRIDQPAQPLAESLRAIARQTGVSVLFDPSKVGDRSSRAVAGQLTAAEAIAKALEGSDLILTTMPDGSIVVRAGGTSGPSPSSSSTSSSPSTSRSPAASSATPARPGASAGGAGDVLALAGGSGSADSTRKDGGAHPETTTLTRVEVTGSRLKRIDADGPTPVNVYTRADIDRSGQPTIERFLSTLNEASMGSGEGTSSQTQGQGTVQLRGLPVGSSLVLINGRRVQASGSSAADYFNLNVIPMAAVERIEVVPVGSSAVYGGDALAGVVNIILKKSIEGVVLEAGAGSGKGVGDRSISVGTGGSSDAGSFMVLGSYRKIDPLTAAERPYFLDADFRRYGGIDARNRYCTPGTVSSTTSANLPGLSSTVAGIPAISAGQAVTVASFAATAGQPNLCSTLANGNGSALIHGSETWAVHGSGEHRLAGSWSAFGELTYVRDRLRTEQQGILINNVLVPATNAYNPFGVAVLVTERLGLENGAETMARATDFKRALIGVRGEPFAGWDFEMAASTTRDDGGTVNANTTANTAARTAALASSNPATALNPFTTGRAASDELLRTIWPDTVRDSHGRKEQVSAFLRGSPLALPTGPVDVIAGAEAARDHYQYAIVNGTHATGDRSSEAVYGEMRVPLWRRGAETGASSDLAALTLAARRDHYSDFGSANTYQAGLELRPTRTALLRASAATSFKPPTLLQTNVNDAHYTSVSLGLVDPLRGNAPVVDADVLRATNPNLNPEKGKAFSLGAVWEPESAAGFRLAATAWKVRIDGLISLLWPQTAVNNEALFPGFVTRAASVGGVPGQITSVLYSEVNYGKVDTSGVDLEIAHAWKTAGARWTLSASATRTTQYDVALTPNTPAVDRLGRRAVDYWAPRWKGRIQGGVDLGAWSLGLTSRYLGAYLDATPSTRSLGSYWVHDLAASLDLKRLGLGLPRVKDARLSLAIANLANHQPEYVGSSPYYDASQADWRGRYGTLRLSVSW